jgi:hypothetical protein
MEVRKEFKEKITLVCLPGSVCGEFNTQTLRRSLNLQAKRTM